MTLSERIKKALQENPSCRDNDNTLCAMIWDEDCKKIDKDFKTISAIEFMHLMDTGQISKQQSILRARRNINNKMLETRGKSYKPQTKKKFRKPSPSPLHPKPVDSRGNINGVLCPHEELLEIHENMHLIKFHTFAHKLHLSSHPN